MRISDEITSAQRYFDYVENHSSDSDGMMVLVALQTNMRIYTLEISFPQSYPNIMPSVRVRKPTLSSTKHVYLNGRICYLHPHMWNPGRHDLTFVIQRAAKWLAKYEVFQKTGKWPGASLEH